MSTYQHCLEAAGATVHSAKYVGSYQGTLAADVTYNGRRGWVLIFYGSCSHCDGLQALLSKFDWDYDIPEKEYASFGRNYLENNFYSTEDLIKYYERDSDWDADSSQMVEYLKYYSMMNS